MLDNVKLEDREGGDPKTPEVPDPPPPPSGPGCSHTNPPAATRPGGARDHISGPTGPLGLPKAKGTARTGAIHAGQPCRADPTRRRKSRKFVVQRIPPGGNRGIGTGNPNHVGC